MSGYSYSSYAIAQAQRERLRVMDALRRQEEEAAELRTALAAALAKARAGLRSTFHTEVARAEQWLQRSELTTVPADTTTTTAQAEEQARTQLLDEGRRAHRDVALAFTEKADALGRQLGAELLDVEGAFRAGRALVQSWDRPLAESLDRDLQRAKELLGSSHYGELGPMLKSVASGATEAVERATALEQQHQQRLYVLDALLATCRRLGFRVLSQPSEQDRAPSTAPLRVRVDTRDKGMIDFTLSLDKIESDSNMVDSYCPREFGELSKQLNENFGVETKFTVEESDARPIDVARDERDLPRPTSRTV